MSWRVHLDDVLERRRTQFPARSPSPAASPRLELSTFMPARPRSLTPTSARSSYSHQEDYSAVMWPQHDIKRASSPRPTSRTSSHAPSLTSSRASSRAASPRFDSVDARLAQQWSSGGSSSQAYAQHLGNASRPMYSSNDGQGRRDVESAGIDMRPMAQPMFSSTRSVKVGLQPRSSSRVFNELPTMVSSYPSRSASPLPSDADIQSLPLDMQKLVRSALQHASSSHAAGSARTQQEAAVFHATGIIAQHNAAAAASYASRPTPGASLPTAPASSDAQRRDVHTPASVPFSPHVGVGDREAVARPNHWSGVLEEPFHHAYLRNIPLPSPGNARLSSEQQHSNSQSQRRSTAASGWLFADGVDPQSRSHDAALKSGDAARPLQASQNVVATLEQAQHVHGDAFGVFTKQQPARTAFPRSITGHSSAAAASALPSPSAAEAAAAEATNTRPHLPARIIAPVVNSALSGGSSPRRSIVSFSPAATHHLYDVSPGDAGDGPEATAGDDGRGSTTAASAPLNALTSGPSSSSSSQSTVAHGSSNLSDVNLRKLFDSSDDRMVAVMMEGMNAHDYAAAFESGAVERLAALVNASNDEVVAIAWRVIRKMFINLNSTHGAAFARAFVQHNMVDAAVRLLKNANMKDTVEIGLWCVSEALLSENITPQLRQQGVVLAICNCLPVNNDNANVMHVAVELLLLLIDNDAASQKVVHDALGVKFVLMNLMNVEIQKASDFDDQYMQDCLWILFNICLVSNQGALDVVSCNGVDLLLYLCDTYANLVLVCLSIIRALVCNFPDIMFASLVDAAAASHLCRFMESGIANQKELAAEVVARLAAQHRKVALLNTADVAISAKVAAVQQVLQSCGVITVLGQLLAVVPSVDANKQDSSVVARGWAIQALLDIAKSHESNVRVMREGSGGVIVRAVRQLKTTGHALASDAERLQVSELDALLTRRGGCCVVS